MCEVINMEKWFFFASDLSRAPHRAQCWARAWVHSSAAPAQTTAGQSTGWRPTRRSWFQELPIKMSQWTKLNIWESSYLSTHLTFWKRNRAACGPASRLAALDGQAWGSTRQGGRPSSLWLLMKEEGDCPRPKLEPALRWRLQKLLCFV